MDLHIFQILFFLGITFFILSFLVKNKEDRFLITVLSCLNGFIVTASAFLVTTYTADGTAVNISEYYALPLSFFMISIIQFLRLFYVSYERLDGNYK